MDLDMFELTDHQSNLSVNFVTGVCYLAVLSIWDLSTTWNLYSRFFCLWTILKMVFLKLKSELEEYLGIPFYHTMYILNFLKIKLIAS